MKRSEILGRAEDIWREIGQGKCAVRAVFAEGLSAAVEGNQARVDWAVERLQAWASQSISLAAAQPDDDSVTDLLRGAGCEARAALTVWQLYIVSLSSEPVLPEARPQRGPTLVTKLTTTTVMASRPPLDATCAYCEAPPGASCVSAHGREVDYFHSDRIRAVEVPHPAVAQFDCPTCDAKAGHPCIAKAGHEWGTSSDGHTARIQLAARAH